jgi:hypothetical protein
MKKPLRLFSLISWVSLGLAFSASAEELGGPSRTPVKGCKWEKVSDARVGLEAWVQRCDFGFRKVDLFLKDHSLFIRYSDGGPPEPVIDILELNPGETPEAGIERVFAGKTPKALASRCVLAPDRENKPPRGMKHYTFVPDAAYERELKAKADANEVPEPPCGDWGTAPDGIQYFEVQPAGGVRRVLFVRVGQDEPLFDEKSLRLLPAP